MSVAVRATAVAGLRLLSLGQFIIARIERAAFPNDEHLKHARVERAPGRAWYAAATEADGSRRLVAYALFAPFTKPNTPFAGWTYLEDFAVDPAFHGRGVGEFLLRGAVSSVGAPRLVTKVELDSAAARRLYAKVGFVDSGERETNQYGTVAYYRYAPRGAASGV